MALQERYFCTFHQRVAEVPLDVRQHYGHPDLLDKSHFAPRGGISRPSKEINLNEDVFAAYNTTLRHGSIVFREYISVGKGRMTNLTEIFFFEVKLAQGAAEQCMARDVYRLSRSLSLWRLMSFYYSGLGFYIHQVLVMRATLLIGYLVALLTLVRLDAAVLPGASATLAFTTWFPLCITLATIIPAGSMVVAEKGYRAALAYAFHIIATFAPLYFIFITQARAHFFARTVRHGGAKYFVSKRTVATSHVALHEVFATYAESHFYPAVDILVVLSVGASHAHQTDFGGLTWMIWFIAACWLVTPFLYNVQAVELPTALQDARLLVRWLCQPPKDGETALDSWAKWWAAQHQAGTQAGWAAPAFKSVAMLYYVYMAIKLFDSAGCGLVLVAVALAIVVTSALPWLVTLGSDRRRARAGACVGLASIAIGATAAVVLVAHPSVSPSDLTQAMAVVYLALVAAGCALEVLHVESQAFVRRPLVALHYTRDLLLSLALAAVLLLLGVLHVPGKFHKHLLFQTSFVKPTLLCYAFYIGSIALSLLALYLALRANGII